MPILRQFLENLWRFGARVRASVGKRDIACVVLRVACVVLGLEFAYVGVANTLLSSNAVVALVQGAHGVKLDYGSAYSIVPGHVHLRRLRLRFEDYNVQFQLSLEQATVDLAIDELFRRRFHALSVLAEGASFRMRHKSHEVGNNGPRFAAYPKIEGFADPPLYYGVEPPLTPDADYDLWSVQVENVVAHVRELWCLEYRFTGDAEARGSFRVQPERLVQVEPAMLRIRSGALTVGEAPVARRMTGSIRYSMPHFEVRTTFGVQAFHEMSTQLQLDLSDGDASFFDVYAGPARPVTLSGPVSFVLSAIIVRGIIQRGSELRAHSPALQVAWPKLSLASEVSLRLGRSSPDPELDVQTQLNGARLSSPLAQGDGPTAREVITSVTLVGVDLSQPIQPAGGRLTAEARLANLAWLDGLVAGAQPHFGGSASLRLELTRKRAGGGDGQLELSVQHGRVQAASYGIYSDVHALARFRTEEEPDLFAQGAVSVRASNGDSLLSLAVAPAVQTLLSAGLSLGALDANVAFHAGPNGLELELTQANCGAVSGRGYFRQPLLGAGRGAALLSAGPLHVGLEVQNAQTQTSALVGSDWLEETWRRLRGLPPQG